MDLIDKATEIREGEKFDSQRIEEFLMDSIPGLEGKLFVKQFPSGFSNLTYLLKFGNSELVLRRPPFGRKAATAHDMGREYKILSALKPVFPHCPEPLVYTEDESIMGCPFYIMRRIEGIILRKDLPAGLSLSPDEVGQLCKNLIDVQLQLHSIDYKSVGLEDFGKPDGYVRRQVDGWSKRYRQARTDDAPDFESVMGWLHGNMPDDTDKPSIIHNDYKFDNVVLDVKDPLKIIGVLDWEMATIGDPLMDLGNSLAYWINRDDTEEIQSMRLLPTNIDGSLTRKELLEYYLLKSGITSNNFNYYYCFGLFRLAVIAQQIYYRFFHGQTKDKRFQMLIFAVQILENSAIRVIEGSGF